MRRDIRFCGITFLALLCINKQRKKMATNQRGRIGLIGSQSKLSVYKIKAIKAAEMCGRKSELLWSIQTCGSWQSVVSLCNQRNLQVDFN
jgi:hypothetical protein